MHRGTSRPSDVQSEIKRSADRSTPWRRGRAPVKSRIPSRPKWTRWITLQAGCLCRVVRTQTAIWTRHRVFDFTLLTLAIPSKRSFPKLAPYWLEAPPLTFVHQWKSVPGLWGLHFGHYDCRNSHTPLVFRSPLELDHLSTASIDTHTSMDFAECLLSWGFLPLQREALRVHLTRVYLTRYGPPSGFLNLLTVCSSLRPVALFHATGTLGVSLWRFPPVAAPLPRRGWWPRLRRILSPHTSAGLVVHG